MRQGYYFHREDIPPGLGRIPTIRQVYEGMLAGLLISGIPFLGNPVIIKLLITMLITDALVGEHKVFYLLFRYLEQALPSIESMAALRDHLAGLSFALEAHARLEDELLFTALEPFPGVQGGPLTVMRTEHDQIIDLLRRAGSSVELEPGRDIAAQMIEVSHGHFQKEEQVLFPMARQFLSDEELSTLGAKWAQRRVSPIGSDKL